MNLSSNNFLTPFSILSLSTGLASSSVILSVSEDQSGNGIIINSSGNLDFSSATWIQDGNTFGSAVFISEDVINLTPAFTPTETYFFSGSTVNSTLSRTVYDTLSRGSFGNTFTTLGAFFTLNTQGGLNDDAAPSQSIFNFDFVLTDIDGRLEDYVDGEVIWDSNGNASGGEQVSFSVAEPIPEPSSSALLAAAALSGLLWRRHHSPKK